MKPTILIFIILAIIVITALLAVLKQRGNKNSDGYLDPQEMSKLSSENCNPYSGVQSLVKDPDTGDEVLDLHLSVSINCKQ